MRDDWLEVLSCHLADLGHVGEKGRHRHRDPQWYCCTSGRFVIEINGSRYECEPGQHILVAPWAYRQLHPSPCERLMLRFRSSCIDHGAWTNQVLAMPEELAPDVKTLFDRLSSSTAGLEPLVESLLLRLLLGVQEAAVSKRRLQLADVAAADDTLRRLDHWIDANLAGPLDREHLARAAHCSPAHLGRLCRERRQCTPRELVLEARMARARSLLLESELSIGAVAGLVGYGTSSHFTVAFTRAHGLGPRDFRRGSGRLWWGRKPSDGGPLP